VKEAAFDPATDCCEELAAFAVGTGPGLETRPRKHEPRSLANKGLWSRTVAPTTASNDPATPLIFLGQGLRTAEFPQGGRCGRRATAAVVAMRLAGNMLVRGVLRRALCTPSPPICSGVRLVRTSRQAAAGPIAYQAPACARQGATGSAAPGRPLMARRAVRAGCRRLPRAPGAMAWIGQTHVAKPGAPTSCRCTAAPEPRPHSDRKAWTHRLGRRALPLPADRAP